MYGADSRDAQGAGLADQTMRTFFQDTKRDDGTPVTIHYGYEDGGSCVVISDCWRTADSDNPQAPSLQLSDAEHERMAAWIMEHRYWVDRAP